MLLMGPGFLEIVSISLYATIHVSFYAYTYSQSLPLTLYCKQVIPMYSSKMISEVGFKLVKRNHKENVTWLTLAPS